MERVSKLEKHSGALKILIILFDKGELMLTKIHWYSELNPTVCNRTLQRLFDLKLISERWEMERYPHRRMIGLTAKGRAVAEKLKEIDVIMQE